MVASRGKSLKRSSLRSMPAEVSPRSEAGAPGVGCALFNTANSTETWEHDSWDCHDGSLFWRIHGEFGQQKNTYAMGKVASDLMLLCNQKRL